MYLVTDPAKGPRHGYPDLILRSGYPYRGPSYDMAKGPPVQHYPCSTVLEGHIRRKDPGMDRHPYRGPHDKANEATVIAYILYTITVASYPTTTLRSQAIPVLLSITPGKQVTCARKGVYCRLCVVVQCDVM